MSNETRHALKVIHDELAGENEAVQYCLAYMADLVTHPSSGITGGIQAGDVPANDVVSDSSAEVFEFNQSPPGSPTGSLSLDLKNGHVTASWPINGGNVGVSGDVRCIESISGPPTDRFLFIIEEPSSGFYVLARPISSPGPGRAVPPLPIAARGRPGRSASAPQPACRDARVTPDASNPLTGRNARDAHEKMVVEVPHPGKRDRRIPDRPASVRKQLSARSVSMGLQTRLCSRRERYERFALCLIFRNAMASRTFSARYTAAMA